MNIVKFSLLFIFTAFNLQLDAANSLQERLGAAHEKASQREDNAIEVFTETYGTHPGIFREDPACNLECQLLADYALLLQSKSLILQDIKQRAQDDNFTEIWEKKLFLLNKHINSQELSLQQNILLPLQEKMTQQQINFYNDLIKEVQSEFPELIESK